MGIEELRVRYDHDANCSEKNFGELVSGVKTCLDCAGIFDADGKGLWVLDKRLDAPWPAPQPPTPEIGG